MLQSTCTDLSTGLPPRPSLAASLTSSFSMVSPGTLLFVSCRSSPPDGLGRRVGPGHLRPVADPPATLKQPLVLLPVGEGEGEETGPLAALPAALHVVAVPVQDPTRAGLPPGRPATREDVAVLEVIDAVAVPLVSVEFADIFVAGVGSVSPPELSAALLFKEEEKLSWQPFVPSGKIRSA
jgi:hypothetical protein